MTCGDRAVAIGASFDVGAGSRLKFGRLHHGARAYLAVAGGVQTPPVLGSRATHLVSRMGGLSGRALMAGDRLPIAAVAAPRPHRKSAGLMLPPKGRALLRVVPGPQDHWFAPNAMKMMSSVRFRISPRSNRMGYRLQGPPLPRVHEGELISEPVGIGAIQVPAAGEPILLMADRQTAGGYPKIGHVISADLPLAGQLAPGDFIEFVFCSQREAVAALIARERQLLRLCRLEGRTVSDVAVALERKFGAERVRRGVPLAPLTTFKVGGPADLFLETQSEAEIIEAVTIAHAGGMKVTLLGGGSNVLVADGGIRGLVIRPRGGAVTPIGDRLVRVDAAVTINGLVRWTINRGYAGLEAWAGTPGTVGGAIYGNAHWKSTNIGELVESVRLARPDGTLLQVPADRMEFDYDYSRLKRTREIVLWAAFRVTPGADPAALRAVARESLAFRKRTQPLESPSAGCIFMNPDPARDRVPNGIPPSAGALVDRAGLKGVASHGARVSPTHANFIINDGRATAHEIHAADRALPRRR